MDEASKDECTLSCEYGYSFKNTFATKKNVFVRGVRYTILPALSLQGIIAVDIMEGSFTKERFMEFVISNVVCKFSIVKFIINYFYLSFFFILDTSNEFISR